jgi:hypothetical protein
MSANGHTHWIKLYVEMLDDPKVGLLPDSIKWRFTSVLLMAGELNEGGFLPDVDEMAWRLRVPPETLQSEMRMLSGRGLVELRLHADGGERWFITKFADRQAPSKNALRQRSWRERHSGDGDSVTNNVTSNDSHNNNNNVIDYTKPRNGNAPETETETETESKNGADAATDRPTDFSYALGGPTDPLDPRAIIEKYLRAKINHPASTDARTYGREWLDPIVKMLELAGGDVALAQSLIDKAIAEARRPKEKDGRPYKIVRPLGLLPFYQTQADDITLAAVAVEADTVWKQVKAALVNGYATAEPRLQSAMKAVGWLTLKESKERDEAKLREAVFNAYRNTAAI